MKQRPKQHKVNNSKEQKSPYTTALFHYTKISVDCNKKKRFRYAMKQCLKQCKVNNSKKNKRVVTLRLFCYIASKTAILLCNIPQFQTETPFSACVC